MECTILRVGIYQAVTQVALLVVASTTCRVIVQEDNNRSLETAPSRACELEPGCPLHYKAPDPSASVDFTKKHNCQLTLGQGRYELALNGNVTECVGGEELPRCARVAAQVTTVVPPRSENIIPARVTDPCAEAALGITEGQVHFIQRCQLPVVKTLVDLTDSVVPLRLFNPTDQPQTVYRGTTAACVN